MVAKRLAALIAAVALIIGAVALRRALDDTSSAGTGTPGTATPGTGTAGTATPGTDGDIVCITELAGACERARDAGASIVVEPYDDTLARIAGGEVPAAWVVVAPLDRLAVDAAGQRVYPDATTTLGASPLVIVAASDRSAALGTTCGAAITWTCIGTNSDKPWADLGGKAAWGRLIAGHGDPRSSATALLTVGSAATSFFGDTTFNQATINGDPDFGLWFDRLEGTIPTAVFALASPLDAILGRKLVSLVGTTEADVVARAGAQRSTLTLTRSGATAVAVAATPGGAAVPAGVLTALRVGLAEAGWTESPPDTTGTALPSPGALRTLRDLWSNL